MRMTKMNVCDWVHYAYIPSEWDSALIKINQTWVNTIVVPRAFFSTMLAVTFAHFFCWYLSVSVFVLLLRCAFVHTRCFYLFFFFGFCISFEEEEKNMPCIIHSRKMHLLSSSLLFFFKFLCMFCVSVLVMSPHKCSKNDCCKQIVLTCT